ncbi:branched-chain amino acid transport system substrate-binding protein [Maridesulfovibrio ferrireducens]|uniref:Branched-chain amino acid transport system substrate-binding protein n=1 Tax=Maridesulfovibrio ferrireducens TaxID=246191 RepID=A0A1G9KFH6_9BACT|nr:ABC transporter substrate-binding protein [Maridesulfovibrio ferrireducens]SDL48558.1 branched-chain amino acid transport system substrate-binding protein [Maridesulfovibrio ferrireducens]
MKKIVLLCLITLGLCFGSAFAADDTVKIGVLYNLTGAMAAVDQPGLHGMELARDVINSEGGVLGKKLSLIISDCRSNLDSTATAAESIADEDGIVAVLGLNDTDYVTAAAPAVTTKGLVFITAGATMQNLPYMYGKNFFMTAFGDNMQARAIAKFAKRRLKTERCFVGTDVSSEFAKTLSKYFKRRYRKYGGVVVDEVWYNAGDTTYPLPKEGDKPDLLFMSITPPDAAGYVTEARKAGFNQPIVSGDGFDTPGLLKIPEEYAHSIYFATHVAFDNPDPEVRDFVDSYKRMFGVAPESGFAALGYDTVMLLAQAITRAGSTDTEAIRAALSATVGFKGVTGDISYPEGVRVPNKTVDIVRFSNGTFSFVEQVSPN